MEIEITAAQSAQDEKRHLLRRLNFLFDPVQS